MFVCVCVSPERKGFLLLAGMFDGMSVCVCECCFGGMSVSRLMSDAAVGPRKASGVQHFLCVTESSGGPR